MVIAEEIPKLHDCFIVNLDIDDSPSAEIPLYDVFDMVTSNLLENYRANIREAIVQILEDTMWVNSSMMATFLNAPFSIFEIREGGLAVSLRTPGLQRLVTQALNNRAMPIAEIQIPILIRFKSPDLALPRPPSVPTVPVEVASNAPSVNSGPPSNVSETEVLDQVSELPVSSPVFQQARSIPLVENPGTNTVRNDLSVPGTAGATVHRDHLGSLADDHTNFRDDSAPTGPRATFRGHPVDVELDPVRDPHVHERDYASYDSRAGGPTTTTKRRNLFDHTAGRATPSTLRTPTKNHPFVDEVTFGAETFEDYMSQFQYSEVKYKDFRKVVIPKFEAGKNSFVHWYKILVSTCLQWGVWCPPYESVQEDNIYGCWWLMLPQSVRNQKSFMGSLLYSLLIKPDTFPSNSREIEAVESSTANQGYNAIYNVLRMHHPLLHSVYSTANQIPQHRRAETFGLYLRRLQEFIARERLATRTYTESEALDLAVRNLSSEWRNDFRRLVERDKRSGNGGTLPFKLALSQIATTFVEYADEVGRSAPGSGNQMASAARTAPTTIMRRLEADTTVEEQDDEPGAFFPDDDVELIVHAIAQNQQSSAVCLGCQQPGHTLTECNRFVDYIVAESLSQRHPTLRTQVANSHSHFRNRLNAATARARAMQPAGSSRTVRSLQLSQETSSDLASSSPPAAEDLPAEQDYRQHSIHIVGDDDLQEDFESCFTSLSIHSVQILGVDDSSPLSAETVLLPPTSPCESLAIRRLAETYDATTASVFAHADNGSMACTAHDSKLLFAYRPLVASNVRLFDAGEHVHRPLGFGFLCVPTDARENGGDSGSVFIRTYHTPTIPGVIISHSAISKQLNTSGYHMSSHLDDPGFIHFPHRLRRCQDTYVSLQPTSQRGGLTFTKALILPTDEQHTDPVLPWPTRIHRLCSDHVSGPPASSMLDPTDGMTCQACHEPPTPDFR
jgi:hypothetical protein